MKKIIKKVLTWLSYIFSVVVLGTIIYVIILTSTGKDISFFGYKMYVVKTDSMEPTIEVDTIILVHKESSDTLDKGTIITFDFNNKYNIPNTHRIVGYYYLDSENNYHSTYDYQTVEEFILDNPNCKVVGYRTQGDNPECEIDSKPVYFDSVLGVYKGNLVVITFLYSLLSNFFGFLFIIIIPLFILLISQLVSLYKMRKSAKLEEEINEEINKQKMLEEEIKQKAIEEYLNSKKD